MIKLLPGGKNSNSNNIKNDKVYIECDKDELNKNEEMTCNLKGYSSEEISIFEGKITSSSNIEISNIKKDLIWIIGENDYNIQLICDGINKDFNIITFNVKGLENGTGELNIGKTNDKLGFTSRNSIYHPVESVTYKITVK